MPPQSAAKPQQPELDYAARSRIERLARDVDAVRRVVNRLDVDRDGQVAVASDGDGQLGDSWIQKRVWSTLDSTRGIDGSRIEVHSRDGTVTLLGAVDDAVDKRRAVELARQVRGVTEVDADYLAVTADDPGGYE